MKTNLSSRERMMKAKNKCLFIKSTENKGLFLCGGMIGCKYKVSVQKKLNKKCKFQSYDKETDRVWCLSDNARLNIASELEVEMAEEILRIEGEL